MMRRRPSAIPLGLMLGLMLAPAAPAAAQAPELGLDGLRLVDQIGGVSMDGVADGERVYLGEGPRVVTYRFDDAGRLVRLGRSDVLPGVVRDLALHPEDGLLAAATGAGGIWLLEAQDHPRVVGSMTARERYTHVAWSGSWLGARVPPVTTALFEHAGDRLLRRHEYRSRIAGAMELAPTETGLAVLERIGLVSLSIDPEARLRPVNTASFFGQGRALASGYGHTVLVGDARLHIVSFDPEGRARVERSFSGGGHTVALSSQSAWIAHHDRLRRVAMLPDGNPNPRPNDASTAWPIDLLVPRPDGRFLLAAGRETEVQGVVRRSEAPSAAGVATFERTDDGLASRSAEDRPGDLVRMLGPLTLADTPNGPGGRRIVIGHDRRRVWAFPLRSGAAFTEPVGAAFPLLPPEPMPEVTDIALWQDLLFVAHGTDIHGFDLRRTPAPTGPNYTLTTADEVSHIWAGDGLLAVYTIAGGQRYYTLSDDTAPRRLRFEPPAGESWDGPGHYAEVAAHDRILVGSTATSIEIGDLSDPHRPRLLATLPTRLTLPGTIVGPMGVRDPRPVVAFDGSRLLRSTGTTLEVYDLRDPRQPRLLTTIDLPEFITDVDLSQGHATVAVADAGIFRFDLRVPDFPDEAGLLSLRDLGERASLVVDGPHVYVGGGESPTPRLRDVTGGWGLIVAVSGDEATTATATPSPDAAPSPSATAPEPAPSATTAAPPPTPTPSRGPLEQMLHLPWVLAERREGDP